MSESLGIHLGYLVRTGLVDIEKLSGISPILGRLKPQPTSDPEVGARLLDRFGIQAITALSHADVDRLRDVIDALAINLPPATPFSVLTNEDLEGVRRMLTPLAGSKQPSDQKWVRMQFARTHEEFDRRRANLLVAGSLSTLGRPGGGGVQLLLGLALPNPRLSREFKRNLDTWGRKIAATSSVATVVSDELAKVWAARRVAATARNLGWAGEASRLLQESEGVVSGLADQGVSVDSETLSHGSVAVAIEEIERLGFEMDVPSDRLASIKRSIGEGPLPTTP